MKPTVNLFFLTGLLFYSGCLGTKTNAIVPRQRPVISRDGHTFVTDDGKLLRGAYWSTDWNGALPQRSYFSELRKRNLNTLHLYGESFASGQKAGMYKNQIDTLVRWTREEGFYLVLTIGNLDKNGTYDPDFIKEFWKIYAPRFANETHVVYEIQNEPFAWQAGYAEDVLEMEMDACLQIRKLAPNTPVLLMSYARFVTPEDVLKDMRKIDSVVDFQNAAIAFHGYAGAEETGKTLQLVLEAGYPCINTEFAILHDADQVLSVDPWVLKLCEDYQISWIVFLTEGQIEKPEMFSGLLKKNNIAWQ
ncbi:MAG: cellulase family glycosylhydrolase [Spirochaetales bacterium]|nr:cellulase family glycosylhydrolase [Spirochaetales bacterium]